MIEDKLTQLKEEYGKVTQELERLNQIALKLSGAIEILASMQTEESKPEVEVVEKEKKEKAK
tara:strand:+ start:477 stop:662 length:186 start_codon:yes stop_codon:yes gene_type:complete